MRVKYLAQEHNAVPRPGLEPGPPDSESSALTIRPPHLPLWLLMVHNIYFSLQNTACADPLGMESHLVKDSQITASSEWDANHAAIQARLNFLAGGGKAGGWSARHNNAGQWLQIDLASYQKVTWIVTQGRNGHNQWVTKYRLQYSDGGLHYRFYHEQGQNSPKVIDAEQASD